jgi:hypothetical protein
VKLNGSETRTEDPVSYKINYNNLKNKPAHNFADLKNIPALFNPVYGSLGLGSPIRLSALYLVFENWLLATTD